MLCTRATLEKCSIQCDRLLQHFAVKACILECARQCRQLVHERLFCVRLVRVDVTVTMLMAILHCSLLIKRINSPEVYQWACYGQAVDMWALGMMVRITAVSICSEHSH
jgi:hypothetical protein